MMDPPEGGDGDLVNEKRHARGRNASRVGSESNTALERNERIEPRDGQSLTAGGKKMENAGFRRGENLL